MGQKNKLKDITLFVGLCLGLSNIILGFILYTLDLHYKNNPIFGIINLIIIGSAIVFGINKFKKENIGMLKLGEALKLGLGIALISAIISASYSIILVKLIDPDFIDKSIEFQKQIMIKKNPNIEIENLNKIVTIQKKFASIFNITSVILIFNLFYGFVISLISGLILKYIK